MTLRPPFFLSIPAGKIAEKAVWMSVFWTKWHCILNADSTKTFLQAGNVKNAQFAHDVINDQNVKVTS